MNSKNTLSVVGFILIIVLLVGSIMYFSRPKLKYSKDVLDTFALCLASKKITMYGAAWCSHCQAQKALFGSSFEKVPYVECPDNQQLCIDKGVTGYPTWIDAAGVKYEGEQSLERLADVTSCVLPQ